MARPHVVIACATSLDGKLSTVSRDPVQFTSRRDRARLYALRDRACALLVGAETIRVEDPPLLPDAARQAARVKAGLRANPVRVVLSRTLDLPVGRALGPRPDAPVYVFTVDQAPRERVEDLKKAGIQVRQGGASLDLARVLETLATEAQVKRIQVEGGGELNATLFQANLVDELELTLTPFIVGGAGAPTLVDGEGFSQGEMRRAKLVESSVNTEDGELFLRYRFDRG
jgi:riboflavin-specific deaminase-like protein